MNQYLPRHSIVSAKQWLKHGDIPRVVPHKNPDLSADAKCSTCGRLMTDHGCWHDSGAVGMVVCPTDWLLRYDFRESRSLYSDRSFRELFQPISEVSDGYHTFNELYDHRHALFLALLSCHAGVLPTWMSTKHDDGSAFDGWFIAGIRLPTGMISYHLPDRLWETCRALKAEVLDRAPKWDGHTPADVVRRLMEFAKP